MAKRGYPTSEDGAAAASARLRQCRSSQEELPAAQGQEWKQGGATPRLRPGAAAGWSNPTSKDRWLHRHRRA